MPSLLTFLLPILLAVAGALMSAPAARRFLALAAIVHALGAASIRIALALPIGGEADPLWMSGLPTVSLRVDAGLQLLAALLAVGGGVLGWRDATTAKSRVAAILAAGTAALVLWTAFPLVRIAGGAETLAAAVAIGAAGAVAGLLVALVVRVARSARKRGTGSSSEGPDAAVRGKPAGPWIPILIVSFGAAIGGRHLYLVLGGAAAAALAAQAIISRSTGARRIPWLPIVVLPALAFAGYYITVIAGPTGLSIGALSGGPFSPAAEAMLVPPLALAAAALMVPWRAAAGTWASWLALVGVALLVRVAGTAFPAGIDGWRTVAMPIGLAAAWGGALIRQPKTVVAAAVWAACFAPEGGGSGGAWALAGWLALASTNELEPVRRFRGSLPARALGAALLGAGGALALDGVLRVEVVYAVFLTAAAAITVMRATEPAPVPAGGTARSAEAAMVRS